MIDPDERRPSPVRRRGAVALVAVVVVLGLVVWALDDRAEDSAGTDLAAGAQPSDPPAGSDGDGLVEEGGEGSSLDATVDPTSVVFPDPEGSRRFDDPVAAATHFGIDVIGFDQIEVGDYGGEPGGQGRVVVTDRSGAETTVSVELMGDGTWYVLAATTPDVSIDGPRAEDAISSPTPVAGRGLAFEGTIEYSVQLADQTEVGRGMVMGSGTPPPGPLTGQISFELADDRPGRIVFRIRSAEDGRIVAATVVRVGLVGS